MKIINRYVKQAAGPFDNKFMHSIDEEFKKQKWFNVKKISEGKFHKFKYTPLPGLEKYKKYYDKYFIDSDTTIQMLIKTFGKAKTDKVELVATIYFCLDEIENSNTIFSEELLIQKVYGWSTQKEKFKEVQIKNCLQWMNEKGLTPLKN